MKRQLLSKLNDEFHNLTVFDLKMLKCIKKCNDMYAKYSPQKRNKN